MKHVHARDIWLYVAQLIAMLKAIEQEEGAAVYVYHLLNYWILAAETKKDPKSWKNVLCLIDLEKQIVGLV